LYLLFVLSQLQWMSFYFEGFVRKIILPNSYKKCQLKRNKLTNQIKREKKNNVSFRQKLFPWKKIWFLCRKYNSTLWKNNTSTFPLIKIQSKKFVRNFKRKKSFSCGHCEKNRLLGFKLNLNLKAKGKASRKNFAVNIKGNDHDVKFQEIEKGIFQEIERTIRRSKERSGDRKSHFSGGQKFQ
jgi:hypothetical protein